MKEEWISEEYSPQRLISCQDCDTGAGGSDGG